MAAANPNPARITDALWRFWLGFKEIEPTVMLGGIWAAKSGYHDCRNNLAGWDYSNGNDVAADKQGPGDKASAIDLTMSREAMIRYTRRLDVAARNRDPRMYKDGHPVLREFIGTKDGTSAYAWVFIGGWSLGVGADSGPDFDRGLDHTWHEHLSVIRKFCNDWEALSGVLSVLAGQTLDQWKDDQNMPTAAEIAAAVWTATATEYVDENQDGTRDPRTRVDILHAIHRGVLRQAAEQRLRDEAILAAVNGLDSAAVLARIEELAAAETQRDQELRALVQQGQNGQLEADEVLRRMGELLTAGTPTP